MRGSRVVIDGLSFAVQVGMPLVLTGPNGSGKTTLLRALAGLSEPESGDLVFAGWPADAPRAELCHYAGHGDAINGTLTVAENIRFWAEYLGGQEHATRRVDAALEQFNLDALADTPVRYLSAGQRRRTGLARLIAAQRPVWLLDEPTVSLDTASVGLLVKAIETHLAEGGFAIAATHSPLGFKSASELSLAPVAARAP